MLWAALAFSSPTMRILLDQGTPALLRAALVGHVVVTAYERGWSTMMNGASLDAPEEDGFDLILSSDQNIRYQQNNVLSVLASPRRSWPAVVTG